MGLAGLITRLQFNTIVLQVYCQATLINRTMSGSPKKFYYTSMNHIAHVALLQKGISENGGIWADLGSGSGAFTLAIADLLGPTGIIYSIDKDKRALKEQEKAMLSNFPDIRVE